MDGSIAVADQVSSPTFTPPGASNYLTAQSVTISSLTTPSTIHYTTDGSDPTTSGTVVSAANPVAGIAIPLNTNMTLRAYATARDVNSVTVDAGYLTWPLRLDQHDGRYLVGRDRLGAEPGWRWQRRDR